MPEHLYHPVHQKRLLQDIQYLPDVQFRYLEELLTKELLDLDSVETQGQENVRQYRREAVQRIQVTLDQLEKKAF